MTLPSGRVKKLNRLTCTIQSNTIMTDLSKPYAALPALHNDAAYIISQDLQQAVDIANLLGQPLLLTGEPGTGKTKLASYLASQMPGGIAENLEIFNAKTTSSATDLFYRYDALQHFQYSQNKDNAPKDASHFIHYQAFGRAIKARRRMVVLIDEVDKAPRDFPNDLLDALDEYAFEVPEIGLVGNKKEKGEPAARPFLIITSNSEKNLPDAFLRRCVYLHVEFPNKDQLNKILSVKRLGFMDEDIRILVEHFLEVRGKSNRKRPATAELIAWAAILDKFSFPVEKLGNVGSLSDVEKRQLYASYSILLKNKDDFDAVKGKG